MTTSTRTGYRYPFTKIDEVNKRNIWNKGRVIPDYDPNKWRRDICGSAISYDDHGNTQSKYGWEIDHIYPSAKGGESKLTNLQPLQWKNNRRKGDNYPWSCS